MAAKNGAARQVAHGLVLFGSAGVWCSFWSAAAVAGVAISDVDERWWKRTKQRSRSKTCTGKWLQKRSFLGLDAGRQTCHPLTPAAGNRQSVVYTTTPRRFCLRAGRPMAAIKSPLASTRPSVLSPPAGWPVSYGVEFRRGRQKVARHVVFGGRLWRGSCVCGRIVSRADTRQRETVCGVTSGARGGSR